MCLTRAPLATRSSPAGDAAAGSPADAGPTRSQIALIASAVVRRWREIVGEGRPWTVLTTAELSMPWR